MCLTLGKFPSIQAIKNKKPKIAKEDIVVYKLLNKVGKEYSSFFRYMPYKQNTLYTVPRFVKDSCMCYASDNFYGYIEDGLHAYTKMHNFIAYRGKVCIKMTIPKGTKYYISDDGTEIVSLALKTPKQFKNQIKTL